MSYTIENINGCTRKINFDFETMDLTREIKTALMEKQKTVNIKGFRKGKAPLAMIEKLYRPQIENDALYGFITNQYAEAVKNENLRPISYPSFSKTKYEPGKSVSFEAIVEIFPEFETPNLSQLSFQKEAVFVEDKEVEDVKNRYLSSKAEMVEIKDETQKAQKGNFAVCNFAGTNAQGEALPQLKGEDIVVELGSGQFLPEFEEGILGMVKNEKKKVPVTFPEDYHEENLQGTSVTFEIELLELKQKELPEFTDEFVAEMGYESVDNFYKKVKQDLLLQKEKDAKNKLFQSVLDKLVEGTKFDVPRVLVGRQEETLKEDLAKTLKRQGFDEEKVQEYFQKWEKDMLSKAEFQVRSGLILDKIARDHNIDSTDADLEKKYEEIAQTTGVNLDEVKKYYLSEGNMIRNLHFKVREEKTFEKILELVKLT